jgi:aspartate-semialdehyde dehydrogenase
VGVELIRCLEQRRFPLAELRLFASARSAGKSLQFRGAAVRVQELTEASFQGVDIALFSAGGSTSRRFAPLAVRAGATVIDNSSAFRWMRRSTGGPVSPQRRRTRRHRCQP